MDAHIKAKPRHRTTIFIIILFALLLIWTLLFFYTQRQTQKKHLAENELQLINQLQRANIQLWRERHLIDAAHITEDLLLNSTISYWLNEELDINSQKGIQEHISNTLRIMQEQHSYNAAYLVDLNGNIVLDALGKTNLELPDEELIAMHKAFQVASPIAIEPRLHPFFGFPFFGVITPIYDQKNQPIASVWLVTDVRKSLYKLIEKWPGISKTAESNLIMQDGDKTVLLSPLRHNALEHQKNNFFSTALSDMHGLFDTTDYRNEKVIATSTLINQSPWILVSKVDSNEVLKSSPQELLGLATPMVLYLLIASSGLIYIQNQGWKREKKLTLELERMMRIDALTNVANRLALDESLDREWANAYRSHTPISFLMIDIDFFKKFNDTYGHLEGDECLKFITQQLSSVVGRSSDLVARYGGEEFSILLPNTSAKDALLIGNRICAHISNKNYKHLYSNKTSLITVSIGLATMHPHQEGKTINVNHLTQRADYALYKAKQAGRNQVIEFTVFSKNPTI